MSTFVCKKVEGGGQNTETCACSHTVQVFPSAGETKSNEAGSSGGRNCFHCVPFGGFCVLSLVTLLPKFPGDDIWLL